VGANTNKGDDPNAGTDKEGAFGGEYTGPVVVLTHHPPEGGDTAEHGIRFATDLGSAVALSKELAGDRRYVNVLGADVAGQLIEAGELDQIVMFVAPSCSATACGCSSTRAGPRSACGRSMPRASASCGSRSSATEGGLVHARS
jgi:hypothetical protein